MNAETFLDKFDLLAESPDAVTRLRHLILQTAAQGRLVEQSAADGSCDELLSSLTEAYEADFDVAGYKPSEPPIPTLPKHWLWAPTWLLCDLQTGKRMKGGAQDSGVISLGGEHLKPDGTVDYTVPRYVSRDFYDDMTNGKVVLHDTLMVKDGATTGKTAFVATLPADGLAAVNEHVFVLRWRDPIDKKLAFYFIRALAPQHIASKSAGLIGGIRREAVLDFPFPLPPLAEQRRIVKKVDVLMAFCDRLEAQQQQREHAHATLTHAALARFAGTPTTENLVYLFHPDAAVGPSEIRKAILALAVQGLLTKQEQGDGAALDLFREIQRVRSQTGLGDVAGSDAQQCLGYSIPPTWCWASLGNLLIDGPTNGVSPKAVPYETPVRSLTLSATTSGTFKGEHSKYIDLDVPRDDDLWLKHGDILVQRGNTAEYVGVAAVYLGEGNQFVYPDLMMRIRVAPPLDPRYIHIAMSEERARDYLRARASGTTGTMPKINQTTLKSLPVALPPLTEQRRIVAKVNDLMALVDRLEADLAAARTTGEKLMDAVVAELCSR